MSAAELFARNAKRSAEVDRLMRWFLCLAVGTALLALALPPLYAASQHATAAQTWEARQ